jgi:hypothetical protein
MRTAAFLLALAIAPVAFTQTVTRPNVRASGTGTVSVRPDQVKAGFSVQTQAATAEESSSQNAQRVTAVLAAIRQILGADADIRTVSFSLSPIYRNQAGQPPVITGYMTSNTVEVTSQDLGGVGRLIDAAIQAGANNVQGLRFGLKDPEPVRRQALRIATTQARADVDAIAAGLNVRLGIVLSAQESSAVVIRDVLDSRVAAGTTTPVETGMVEVSATVVLEVEISGQ